MLLLAASLAGTGERNAGLGIKPALRDSGRRRLP